jgi:cytoskeletal protein RodZ
MKARRKTKPSKNKKLIIAATALVITGLAGFWVYNTYVKNDSGQKSNTINYDAPTEADKEIVDEHKEEISKDQDKTEEPEKPETISLVLTRASQLSDGQPLNIRTVITGTSNGTCQVTLTKSGQTTVTKTFPVVFEATSASCDAANIAASEFSAEGDWQLKVIVVNDSQQSNTVEQTVSIKK